jgi:putative glutamine amidotransferase
MSTRPVIGIPTQTLHAIEGIPEALPASWVMSQRYFLAATAAGAVPWMIPLLDDDRATLREIFDRLDGLLLPGGVDMDPCTFGEAMLPACGRIDPARDRVEIQLTRWAVDEGTPVLGLCRGLQVINVALGGSLYQDLRSQMPGAIKHDYFPTAGSGYGRDYLAHEVTLAPGSRILAALGRSVIGVNSMHHQGIRELAAPLLPVATAPDGLVEAVELRKDQFLVGVQWHPEVFEPTDVTTRRLFQDFVTAARTRQASRMRT